MLIQRLFSLRGNWDLEIECYIIFGPMERNHRLALQSLEFSCGSVGWPFFRCITHEFPFFKKYFFLKVSVLWIDGAFYLRFSYHWNSMKHAEVFLFCLGKLSHFISFNLDYGVSLPSDHLTQSTLLFQEISSVLPISSFSWLFIPDNIVFLLSWTLIPVLLDRTLLNYGCPSRYASCRGGFT